MNVYAAKNANMIELAGRVKTEMAQLTESFPENYSVKLIRDNSTEIKDELSQILNRTGVTILILLLFVYLVSRDFRYLGIITTCLLANLSIALVFYFFQNRTSPYTLAGITVSFGIIIDSVIVIDRSLPPFSQRKAFLAVLAATLTTVGAITVIFNMDNNIMKNMWDFSAVIIINLGVSLAVALFSFRHLWKKFR
ncbi:MAG: efflux RND transporter permease subunit [Butyricimonas virosa]